MDLLKNKLALPLMVVIMGLAAAAFWGATIEEQNRAVQHAQFDALVDRTVKQILDKFSIYERGLKDARGMVMAAGGEKIDYRAFTAYVGAHRLAHDYPGMRGIGFIRRVPDEKEAAFVEHERREGRPDFKVWQLAPYHGEHFIIEMVEPIEVNRQAVGLDTASETNRRIAGIRSMESGETTLSAPITLVQATNQKLRSFLMYVPLTPGYSSGSTAAARREITYGWVYSPLLIDEVLADLNLPQGEVYATLSDVTDADQPERFYASSNEPLKALPGLKRRVEIPMYGRKWALEISAAEPFVAKLDQSTPMTEAGGVMLVAALIAVLLYTYLSRMEQGMQEDISSQIGNAAPEAMLVADDTGRITYVNSRLLTLFGYTHKELHGRPIEILLPERFHQAHIEERNQYDYLSRIMGMRRDVIARRRNGTEFPVEVSLGVLQTGKRRLIIAMIMDITGRKRVEEQVKSTTQLLDNILENIPSVIFLKKADDLRYAYLNRAGERLLGVERAALLDRSDYDFFPKERADFFTAKDREVLEQEGVVDIPEEKIETAQGERQLHTRKLALRNEDGKPAYLLGISEDITELKEKEEGLELFARVFDISERAIGIADGEGKIIYANPAMERMFGYAKEELIGRNYPSLLTEESQDKLPGLMKEVVAGRGWEGILSMRHKGGSLLDTANSVGGILGSDGKLRYIFNIFYDYGPELLRQQELQNARNRAEKASQAKSEFLSSMSHELRTPMNAILGFSQLMELDDTLSEENKGFVQEINKAGRHLLELINDVLDLAKIESGRVELSLEAVELLPVVEECLNLVSTLAAGRNVEITHAVPASLAVRADRTRLVQMLLNLLSNAIKYNRDGGKVRIEAMQEGGDRLRICVSDTGPGIDMNRLDELFQPFNRLDASRTNIEGTGIGLNLTRRIAEMMGGSVNVRSELGVGSTFWIELPKEHALVERRSSSMAGQVAANVSARHTDRHFTVLYVEDNPSNIRLIAHVLSRLPHLRLLTAHNGELGMELALSSLPDLILLDINMPGMNGYDVLRELKMDARTQNIPVVAITANAMPSEIEHGKRAGFVEYLTKPLNMAHFIEVVNEQLGLR